MASEVGVGAIAAEDFWGGVPRVICKVEKDSSCSVFLLVYYTSSHKAAFNKCACSGDAPREHGYKQVSMITADKQPRIEMFHAQVDVIMFATKRVDLKDVTGH